MRFPKIAQRCRLSKNNGNARAKRRLSCLLYLCPQRRCCLRLDRDRHRGSRCPVAGPWRALLPHTEGLLPPRSRQARLRIPRSPVANGVRVHRPVGPPAPISRRLGYGRARLCLAFACLSPISLGTAERTALPHIDASYVSARIDRSPSNSEHAQTRKLKPVFMPQCSRTGLRLAPCPAEQ